MEKKQERSRWSLEAVLLALLLFLIALISLMVGLKRWLPPVASEHGSGIDLMINYLLVATGALFIIGHLVLGVFIWRFSRQDQATFRLPTPKVERLWILVPVLLMTIIAEGGVLVLGLPVWSRLYASEVPPDAVSIEVTGEQFLWNIRYPGPDSVFGRVEPRLVSISNPLGLDSTDPAGSDDIVQPGEIVLPVNRPVKIRLRSKDTLHSLFLPHFRVKQDAVPGMNIEFWFVPNKVGEFEYACTEVCGLGHYQMKGTVRVLPTEEFAQWLSAQ